MPSLSSIPLYLDYSYSLPRGLGIDDDFISCLDDDLSPSIDDFSLDALPTTPPMAPLVADINLFELAWSMQPTCLSVNPADTLIVQHVPDSPSSAHSSPVPFSNALLDEIFSVMSASAQADQLALNDVPQMEPVTLPPLHILSQDLECPPMPSTPNIGILQPVNLVNCPRPPAEVQEIYQPHMGTPVLDAHRGVHLSDLRAKADRYRQRNPGQDIDKKWLNSFAGKLSARGELLEDFRCYVLGCFQTNKRRDHILIHVGSHVDQRPFVCSHCPMRFLRKNECKRHEASHTGNKPYVCDICPGREKAFVRLDLLRRHLKRAHSAESSADKENVHRSTKRTKLCL